MLASAFYWLQRAVNPPLFAIDFARGEPRIVKGLVPAAWLADCAVLAAQFGIHRGRVDGVRTWRGVELRFSPDLPAASHQRFRNTFGVHRAGKF